MDVFNVLAELATCLCRQIKADGLPDLCFCGVVPGDAASDQYTGDCSNDGMAWVRLITAYPANAVGEPLETPNNCGFGMGLDIELGIMRCVPVGSDDGDPPTAEELLAATDAQVANMMAMQKAVICCPAINMRDTRLNSYVPIGPEGGLNGGTWTISTLVF